MPLNDIKGGGQPLGMGVSELSESAGPQFLPHEKC